jgi:hypothetical protein
MSIVHERKASMLLFQLGHEADLAGRIDAMNLLQSLVGGSSNDVQGQFAMILRDRINRDPSRLLRKVAKEVLAKLK